jgi:hypothetical protein
MKIDEPYLSALEAHGYTRDEASFLYLVATHSGYFVARQFLAFSGATWGRRTSLFWSKLQRKKHARTGALLPRHRAVYHIFARELYRDIGRENLRNRRGHEREYIEARLAILDFVLANPELAYLETEADKLDFFCRELKIDARHLPSKTYLGRKTVQPTLRYFVDRFPLFLNGPRAASSRIATFSFIQGSGANLSAFAHHLRAYGPLFRELAELRFLFLARSEAYFAKAGELFHALVTVPLEATPADDLLRYFAIRKSWDLHEYGALSESDLAFRNVAKLRFSGERFEHFYRAWKAGRIGEAHIRAAFQGHHLPHVTHFEARILKPFTASVEGIGETT